MESEKENDDEIKEIEILSEATEEPEIERTEAVSSESIALSGKNARARLASKELAVCALFSALIAAGAFIKIPVPYMPFTMQTFFTMLAALLLPPRLAVVSLGCYIALGLAGVPIFTAGGGIFYVLQPTFGYLVGFLIATPLAAVVAKRKHSVKNYAVASALNIAIYSFIGLLYYYFISTFYIGTEVGAKVLLVNCFLMTLPADILKMFFACFAAKRLRPVLFKTGIYSRAKVCKK